MRRLEVAVAGVVGALMTGASLVLVGITAQPAGALTTFTVDNAGDHIGVGNPGACMPSAGSCMLRDAFAAANLPASGATQINIPASLGPITLTSGNVLPFTGGSGGTQPLTLTGTGGNATVAQMSGATQGVITDSGTGLLTIQSLTITGGNTAADGGGINAIRDVTVNNSTVSGNHAAGVFGGGGISTANGSGFVTVTNSTITANTAPFGGGGISSNGTVSLTQSVVANNISTQFGGGIETSNARVVNSTVSNNTGGQGGGIDSNLPVDLAYATVVDNTAPVGANISQSGTPLTSFASVVALPHGSANCSLGGAPTTFGFNFSDDSSCGFTGATDKQNAGDPMLGTLAANGGPTVTRLPKTGSPLIDAIPNSSCQAPPVGTGIVIDQRGLVRPSPAGGACDVGAVEVQAPAPLVIIPRFTG